MMTAHYASERGGWPYGGENRAHQARHPEDGSNGRGRGAKTVTEPHHYR